MRYQTIPVTHYQQNCTVLWCETTSKAAVVDPGGDVDRLIDFLRSNHLILESILLTHGHMDHVGGTVALQQAMRSDEAKAVPIIGPHKEDMMWISALDQQAQMMGFQPVEGFVPDQFLQQGDRVSVGQQLLEVRYCPGHTPGHVVLYHAESKLVLVGDVLFKGSVGRTDFPRGDFDTLVHSIRTQLWTLPDDTTFIPGHGPVSTIGEERRTNPFVADKNFG